MISLDCGAGSQVASGAGRTNGASGGKRDSAVAPPAAAMECVEDGDGGGWVEMGRMGDSSSPAAVWLDIEPDGGVCGAADDDRGAVGGSLDRGRFNSDAAL